MKRNVSMRTVTWRVGRFRGEARADAEGPVATTVLPDPSRAAHAGRVLRRHRHRVTARVVLPGIGAALLKVHEGEEGWRAVLGRLRETRASREWRAARYLDALGVPVAEPLAWGVSRGLWRVRTAFFAARFVEGRVGLVEALAAQPPREAARLLRRAGDLVGSLLARGFIHDDLHPGNLLVGRGPGGTAPLLVTDLHRVRIARAARPGDRARVLGRLLHGLMGHVGPGGRARLLAAAIGEGRDRHEVVRTHAEVERAIHALEVRRRASRTKRCLLESGGFTRDLPAPWVGARRRTLTAERLVELLAAHDDALARGDRRVVKDGRRSAITAHGDEIVKEARDASFGARWRTRLVPGRHRRGYVGARRLEVVGVGTAAPLAFVRANGRSFSVFEDLSAFTRLDHLVRRLARLGDGRGLRRLGEASADFFGRLHAHGVYHGDLKAANVLVDDRASPPRFHLVDTDSVRLLRRPVSDARRWKNLAQLAASIPVVVSRSDRLRWFRRYAAGEARPEGRRAFERTVARETAAHLARKIIVRDEPIE